MQEEWKNEKKLMFPVVLMFLLAGVVTAVGVEGPDWASEKQNGPRTCIMCADQVVPGYLRDHGYFAIAVFSFTNRKILPHLTLG